MGGNLTIFDKNHDITEEGDREQLQVHQKLQVLTAKHRRSLRLLCTVGGNQVRSDARSEFKILERSPKGGGEAGRAQDCTAISIISGTR